MSKTKVGTIKSKVKAIRELHNSCFMLVKRAGYIDPSFPVEYFEFQYEIGKNGPFVR